MTNKHEGNKQWENKEVREIKIVNGSNRCIIVVDKWMQRKRDIEKETDKGTHTHTHTERNIGKWTNIEQVTERGV